MMIWEEVEKLSFYISSLLLVEIQKKAQRQKCEAIYSTECNPVGLQVSSFSIAKSQSRLGSGDIRDPNPGPSQRSESDRGITKEADGELCLGVEEDAHVFEKKEWALCACV